MTDAKDGGPAFPRTVQAWDGNLTHADGMTLRDWFAGMSTAGGAIDLLHREGCEAMIGEPMPEDMVGMVKWRMKVIARLKYIEADAMIAAREKADD